MILNSMQLAHLFDGMCLDYISSMWLPVLLDMSLRSKKWRNKEICVKDILLNNMQLLLQPYWDLLFWVLFFFLKGNLNLITQALAAVGCKMEVIPDPTTVHFHLPNSLSVQVHREYNDFISELTSKFPHEKEGILKFYSICWKVCFDFWLRWLQYLIVISHRCFYSGIWLITIFLYVSDF